MRGGDQRPIVVGVGQRLVLRFPEALGGAFAPGVAELHTDFGVAVLMHKFDDALELGEERPDYLFFGRFGYDNKPEPHPRNLALGAWWAEMIEIPCIVMGGLDIASVEEVAVTGAEFVALRQAVFQHPSGPALAVAEANAVLAEKAPRFET